LGCIVPVLAAAVCLGSCSLESGETVGTRPSPTTTSLVASEPPVANPTLATTPTVVAPSPPTAEQTTFQSLWSAATIAEANVYAPYVSSGVPLDELPAVCSAASIIWNGFGTQLQTVDWPDSADGDAGLLLEADTNYVTVLFQCAATGADEAGQASIAPMIIDAKTRLDAASASMRVALGLP
jgi:hypothetical protein